MDEILLSNLQDRIWKGGGAGEEDMMRWYDQGFVFGDSPNFGLRQTCGGGPCGVLAAVMCEMVKVLLFSKDGNMIQGGDMQPPVHDALPTFTQDEVYDAFSFACVAILFRASTNGSITLIDCPNPRTYHDLALYSPSSDFILHTFGQTDQAIQFVRQRIGSDQLFGSRCGCILFVMSLLLTRGLSDVVNDMDVESNTMIGPFGHCNQELMNLLLTGQATSNIMDGSVTMAPGLIVKGIAGRSDCGYLTHLEALRYCVVGEYLKRPKYPVWVVGSSSHFTVLFALDGTINEDTYAEKMLSQVKAVFKRMDPDDNGFVPSQSLKQILVELDMVDLANDETTLARLRGHLQIDGEIILWSSLWENLSRLMANESTVDSLIDGKGLGTAQGTGQGSTVTPSSSSSASVMMDLTGDGDNSFSSSSGNGIYGTHLGMAQDQGLTAGQGRPRSDSDYARELQAQWAAEDGQGAGLGVGVRESNQWGAYSSSNANDITNIVPNLIPTGFATGLGTTTATHTPLRAPLSFTPPPPPPPPPPASSPKLASSSSGGVPSGPLNINVRKGMHRHDSFAGDDSKQHSFFLFNGLESITTTSSSHAQGPGLDQGLAQGPGLGRRAALTPFKMRIRSSENAIGKPIAMHSDSSSSPTSHQAIEEVLRTRWPGCKIDWNGLPAPSID